MTLVSRRRRVKIRKGAKTTLSKLLTKHHLRSQLSNPSLNPSLSLLKRRVRRRAPNHRVPAGEAFLARVRAPSLLRTKTRRKRRRPKRRRRLRKRLQRRRTRSSGKPTKPHLLRRLVMTPTRFSRLLMKRQRPRSPRKTKRSRRKIRRSLQWKSLPQQPIRSWT